MGFNRRERIDLLRQLELAIRNPSRGCGAVEIRPNRSHEFRLFGVERFDARIAMQAAHCLVIGGRRDPGGERGNTKAPHELIECGVLWIDNLADFVVTGVVGHARDRHGAERDAYKRQRDAYILRGHRRKSHPRHRSRF